DRAQGGELHRLHALRALLSGLVHLHRGAQGEAAAPPRRRPRAHGVGARPLRHRLRALHVLRHLRRGLPVRRAVLEPRVRVLGTEHCRAAARQGPPRRVDGHGARTRAARARRRDQGQEVAVAENVVFGILAAAMAFAALGVVRTNNVVHAALYLVVVLAGGAAQFILLGQEFVAWVQVLVYIGAVIVLFLFGIMLTRAPMHPSE